MPNTSSKDSKGVEQLSELYNSKIPSPSSNLAQVGYKRRTMHVVFKNGKSYEFKKVPRAQFDKFCSSTSKGQFFIKEVKDIYPHTQLAH